MRSSSTSPNLANATGVTAIANGGTGSATGMTGINQLLFVLRSADMQLTTDQVFTKVFTGTNYAVTNVLAARKTGAASIVCAGGVYTAASKGGDALVGVAQSWVTLAASKIVAATLAALTGTNIESATPYLSLTTGSTAACTADVFIFGVVID